MNKEGKGQCLGMLVSTGTDLKAKPSKGSTESARPWKPSSDDQAELARRFRHQHEQVNSPLEDEDEGWITLVISISEPWWGLARRGSCRWAIQALSRAGLLSGNSLRAGKPAFEEGVFTPFMASAEHRDQPMILGYPEDLSRPSSRR